MEKLLELLNNPEFEPSSKIEHWTEIAVKNCDYLIISKNRGFIQKLIENDCVDLDGFPQIEEYSDYESLLMMLSIQDDPIKYLISILK